MSAGSCPVCGGPMVPMIMSSFCPRDCDRGGQRPPPTPDIYAGWELAARFLPLHRRMETARLGKNYWRWQYHARGYYHTLVLHDTPHPGSHEDDHLLVPGSGIVTVRAPGVAIGDDRREYRLLPAGPDAWDIAREPAP